MGLAVSLVSPHQEKVWYYDKRKWEGKTLSTKLADQGGCCIWYDEPLLLQEVEKRLGAPLQTLEQFVASGGDVKQQLAKYGQAKDGGLNEASNERLQTLAPAIRELALLEKRAQHSFLLGIRQSLQPQPTGAVGGGAAATPQAMEVLPSGGGADAAGACAAPGAAGRDSGASSGRGGRPSLRGGGGRGGGGAGTGRNKRGRL